MVEIGVLRSDKRSVQGTLLDRYLLFVYGWWLLRGSILSGHCEPSVNFFWAILDRNLTSWLSLATDPQCPEGLMQWQHGTYSLQPNGSLVLVPFAVDGRQLLSSPCDGDYSEYTRYNQTEVFRVGVSPVQWFFSSWHSSFFRATGCILTPSTTCYAWIYTAGMAPLWTHCTSSISLQKCSQRRPSIRSLKLQRLVGLSATWPTPPSNRWIRNLF